MMIDKRSRSLCLLLALSGSFVIAHANPVRAQSAEPAPTQLPGIVVQGATLAPVPARRPQPETTAPAQPARSSAPSMAPPGTAGSDGTAQGGAEGSGAFGNGGDGYSADTVGSALTVVTGDELRNQQIRHAGDALRSLPGVSVNRTGGFGGLTQVRIRGAEANHTLVLVDGIVANDTTTGSFDFSDLSADNIERIEIIRGPQSGLYGSNALGGVVNIITKGGKGPLEVTARAEAGAFRTFDYALRASGGNDKAWASMSYNERHSTGFNVAPFGIENDGLLMKSFSLKGGAMIAHGLSLDYVLRYSDKRGDRDTEGGPVGSLAVQVDENITFGNTVFLGGVNLRWDTLDGRVTHIIRASRNETHTTDAQPSFRSDNLSETLRYGYLGTVRFDTPAIARASHALTVLVDKEAESFTANSDFADHVTRDRGRVAAALEYKGDLAQRLFFTANVRHDDNDIFEDFTTWRTAVSLKLPEIGLRPHASVGTAVKLPTMFETFGFIPNFFTPNPNLKPEQSQGWDAGLEFGFWQNRAILDVTYFSQDLTDKIDGLAAGPGGSFTAVNTPGISLREGVELEAKLRPAPWLRLSGAYTYLMAVEPTGLTEVRRPRDSARADLTYLFHGGRGSATVSGIYNGAATDVAFRIDGAFPGFLITSPERVKLDDYWLINLAASYKVQPGVEVFGRVENLLNEKYFEIYGFATPGIAAYAGVKLTFGGEGAPSLWTGQQAKGGYASDPR